MRSICTHCPPIAATIVALACVLAPRPAIAGFPGERYPIVIDIDNDGHFDGVLNPNTAEEVELRTGGGPLEALAFLFFGDGAFSQAELQAANQPPVVEFVGPTPETIYDCESDDLDCDGDEDVLAASFENLSRILQTSAGEFSAPTPCGQIGGSPFSENCVKLADLSGDQCPEIVAVSNNFTPPSSGLIQVFPNNGAGIFAAPITQSVPGVSFNANAVGDIDADSVPEVAVLTSTSVSILRRTAPNTLTPLRASTGQPLAPTDPFSLSQIPVGTFLFDVQLTDLNADGKAEIIACNLNDVFIKLNNGNGTFGPNITLDGDSSTRKVVAADVNADGTADIFAINSDNQEVHYWPSTGPMQWGPRTDIPVGAAPSALLIEDTNNDALPDLLTVNRVDGDAAIYFNTGAGNFAVPQRFAGFSFRGGVRSTAYGDFNADGFTDVVASVNGGDLALFLNRADGSGLLLEPAVSRVSFRDFDVAPLPPPASFPAGSPDRIVLAIPSNATIALLEYDADNPPTNPFTVIGTFTAVNTMESVATSDINADGVTDIIVTHASATPAARVFLGDASGGFPAQIGATLPGFGWRKFLIPSHGGGLPAGRFYMANESGAVTALDFSAGAFTPGTTINFGVNGADFAIGDIDADGIDDLIAARTGPMNGTLSVQTGLTSPSLPAQTTVPLPRNPASIALGDVNADGKNDVLIATNGPANQNQYVVSILNAGGALDPGTTRLHPAGERPGRPLLADLHLPIGSSRPRGGLKYSNAGPEAVIGNADSTNFQYVQTLIVLPNQVNFAPPSPACRADFNSDGVVSTPDLAFFLGRFGETATPGSQAERADFNDDGTVNTPDLAFFLGRFGEPCP